MFNKEEYNKSKAEVIEMIKKSHNWESTEGFIADGLISPDDYEKSKVKIAVFLSESYGYDKNEVTEIENQPKDDIMGISNSKVQSPRKIAALLWILFKSLSEKNLIALENIPSLFSTNEENTILLQEALKKVAWINVKKASNPGIENTKQNNSEIYNHALKNKNILKKQINSINPDLYIICGNPVSKAICEMELVGENLEMDKKWIVQFNSEKKRIVFATHPSYFKDWSYAEIHGTCKIILDSFLSKEN